LLHNSVINPTIFLFSQWIYLGNRNGGWTIRQPPSTARVWPVM